MQTPKTVTHDKTTAAKQRDKGVTAFNLCTDMEYHFDCATTPEWAVAYAYCEENHMMSALFTAAQDLDFVAFCRKHLDIIYGQRTVACGNWVSRKTY